MSYRPIDRNYDAEHEAAIRVAERDWRPFTRFYVIGTPVTFNNFNIPFTEPTWDERCDFGDLDGPYG